MLSSAIEKSIEVRVPARTAYEQWSEFTELPRFMTWIKSAERLDDSHVRWHAQVAGKELEGEMEICERIPEKRIAWRSVSGPPNAGVVTFHRLSDDRAKIMFQVDYEPMGVVEKVCDRLGLAERQIGRDLDRFKELIERRGVAAGAWRGSVSPRESAPRARR